MTKTTFGKVNSADQRQIPISTHSMACKLSFQVAFLFVWSLSSHLRMFQSFGDVFPVALFLYL